MIPAVHPEIRCPLPPLPTSSFDSPLQEEKKEDLYLPYNPSSRRAAMMIKRPLRNIAVFWDGHRRISLARVTQYLTEKNALGDFFGAAFGDNRSYCGLISSSYITKKT